MSKKSERTAQVRKQRIAETQSGPRKVNAVGTSVEKRKETPGEGSRQPLPKWAVIAGTVAALLAALSCLSAILSLIVPPSVTPPDPIFGSIAPTVEIVNGSLLPVYNLQSGCELTAAIDQSGFAVSPKAPVSSPSETSPVLSWGQKAPVACRGQMDLTGIRVKSTEFRVSISYLPLGWPFRRHTEYQLKGAFDPQGNLPHWTVE